MIKFCAALVVVLVGVLAEQPRGNSKFQKVAQAPYRESGWTPSGEVFTLPQQTDQPPVQYGPPKEEYGPPQEPQQEYGPPATESVSSTTTTENINEVETVTPLINERNGRLTSNNEQGTYYIYHPSGVLQRVVYNTKDNTGKMEFSAKLKYEVVEPIRGPIYTYDNDNLVLRRL
ncbi:unnamed protein product [Brassicogethes aeneus]|uniref:DUF4794 domain-containing protein n=1 Tax=Brassicogethes aeneus TaxID=1431903 RepID=A0A9P0B284_BRAAE|nr:unnamed protein product [Brassicogethes aeneus]